MLFRCLAYGSLGCWEFGFYFDYSFSGDNVGAQAVMLLHPICSVEVVINIFESQASNISTLSRVNASLESSQVKPLHLISAFTYLNDYCHWKILYMVSLCFLV